MDELYEVDGLGMPADMVVWMEGSGWIVDLGSGEAFRQVESWSDFAERWLAEMARRGEVPTAMRMGQAIKRAQGERWSLTFCNLVAIKVFNEALEKWCDVQIVA
jgi:hypothetical protein